MPELGDKLDIYCRYCRKNLNGVVSALQDGKIAKVRCRTCGHFQVYKPQKDMKKAKQRAMKRLMNSYNKKHVTEENQEKDLALNQDAAIWQLWDQETETANIRNTKVYDIHRTYKVNDFISDKALGLGKVMEINDNLMKVLFRDGIEDIEHARPKDDD